MLLFQWVCAYVHKDDNARVCVRNCVYTCLPERYTEELCVCVCLLPCWWWREQCGSADEMRLKPVRGSIRGKTSDGYTATASNNEISPEVEQRAGNHICVCMFVCGCECVDRDREMGEKRGNEGGWGRRVTHTLTTEAKRNKAWKILVYFSSGFVFREHDTIISIMLRVEISSRTGLQSTPVSNWIWLHCVL